MFIWIHYRTFHIRSFECLLCALPLVIVRDLFEAIAVVGTTFRYDLSLPPREPRRVGVVAVSLKISELFSICMITQPWLKYIGRHYVLLGSRFFLDFWHPLPLHKHFQYCSFAKLSKFWTPPPDAKVMNGSAHIKIIKTNAFRHVQGPSNQRTRKVKFRTKKLHCKPSTFTQKSSKF